MQQPGEQAGQHRDERSEASSAERTTMPMSDLAFSSTVLSRTQFMNWSKPRSTPVTCLFWLIVTAAAAASLGQRQA